MKLATMIVFTISTLDILLLCIRSTYFEFTNQSKHPQYRRDLNFFIIHVTLWIASCFIVFSIK